MFAILLVYDELNHLDGALINTSRRLGVSLGGFDQSFLRTKCRSGPPEIYAGSIPARASNADCRYRRYCS